MKLTVLALLVISTGVGAQQLPQYSLFSVNPYPFNPALAGTEDFLHAQASVRSQWTGISGAPQTTFFSAHSPLNKKTIGYKPSGKFAKTRWLSAGMIITADKTGPVRWNSGYATLAYNLPLSSHGLRFSFACNVGVKSVIYDPSGFLINIKDAQDATIESAFRRSVPDVAFGVWLYDQKFFAGFSSQQLLQNSLNSYDYNYSNNALSKSQLLRHYFLMMGYKIGFHDDLFLVPALLVKVIEAVKPSYEVSTKAVYRQRYWVGGSYRHQDSFSMFAGALVGNKFEFTYGYDIATSNIRYSTSGSHELMIGYRFALKPKVLCPDMFW